MNYAHASMDHIRKWLLDDTTPDETRHKMIVDLTEAGRWEETPDFLVEFFQPVLDDDCEAVVVMYISAYVDQMIEETKTDTFSTADVSRYIVECIGGETLADELMVRVPATEQGMIFRMVFAYLHKTYYVNVVHPCLGCYIEQLVEDHPVDFE